MKSYDEYKDSGIEWIGEIPKDWTLSKIKWEYIFDTGFTPPSGNDEYYDYKGYPWANISDIKGKIINNTKNHISEKAIKKFSPQIIEKDSLLFSFKLSIGNVVFIGNDMYANEAIAFYRSSINDGLRYLYYSAPVFITKNFRFNIYGAKLLNQFLINDACILIPSMNEQQKIASFLDKKTTAIDSIIEKKGKLIEKLEAYKKSIITEAVTKGKLGDKYINENGELVDEIEMKDSGVEWVGEIPKHWEITKYKFMGLLINGYSFKSDDYTSEGVPILRIGNIQDDINIKNLKKIPYSIAKEFKDYEIHKGDILLALTGATIGKSALYNSDKTVLLNQRVGLLRSIGKINQKFLLFLIQSEIFQENIRYLAYGGAQENIGKAEIGHIEITRPNKFEQQKIANFLDKETKKITDLIDKTQQSIKKYKAYKKSLIYEAVTGKIDLRNYDEGGNNNVNPNNS